MIRRTTPKVASRPSDAVRRLSDTVTGTCGRLIIVDVYFVRCRLRPTVASEMKAKTEQKQRVEVLNQAEKEGTLELLVLWMVVRRLADVRRMVVGGARVTSGARVVRGEKKRRGYGGRQPLG